MSTTLQEININKENIPSTPSPLRRKRENIQILVSLSKVYYHANYHSGKRR